MNHQRGGLSEALVTSYLYEIYEEEDDAEAEHDSFVLTTQTHMLLPLIEVGT